MAGQWEMRRRVFLSIFLGVGSATWSFAINAQQAAKVWRIGVLETISPVLNAANFDAFRTALRDLGYYEGQNLAFEYRLADGQEDRFPALAIELVQAKVDVILTRGTPAVIAAKGATTTLPIVMAASGDPLASGAVAALARPGGNVTGFSAVTNELIGKRIELLNEVAPKIAKIGFVQNMRNPIASSQWEEAQAAARSLHIASILIDVGVSGDLARGFETVRQQQVDALVVGNDTITQANRRQIIDLAAQNRVLAVYATREFVEVGGLMVYAVDYADLYRRAAGYVDKIFRGAKPADLPVEQPSRFELVINLKTANALGLKIPPILLARADEVIE
jgi:putative tryptophan/tyrosine transport system substrate-binding protein